MNDRMIESIIESERSFTVINRSIIRRRGKITRIKYLFFEHHKIFFIVGILPYTKDHWQENSKVNSGRPEKILCSFLKCKVSNSRAHFLFLN
jgi:hypothetical protein